jgi:A/G-specific adenine glycosylase
VRLSPSQQIAVLSRGAAASLVHHLIQWFEANARDLPWRRTRDPYPIWISEIMLQQTQVATVINYWERWMKSLPNIQAVAEAEEQQLLKLWEGLGYYTRVRNIQKAARQIIEEHNGRFPRRHEDLLSLPGIGRYTAGAISSIAFDEPHPIVDGNVTRVLARLFGVKENAKERSGATKFWEAATALVQKASELKGLGIHRPCSSLNQALMELGATVCLPRGTRCHKCPLTQSCYAFANNAVEKFPFIAPRPELQSRTFLALVLMSKGQVLVRQRDRNLVNGGFWEFANWEDETPKRFGVRLSRLFGRRIDLAEPFHQLRHSITRYRITVQAFSLEIPSRDRRLGAKEFGGRWVGLAELETLPFTSAHRKIARVALSQFSGAHAGRLIQQV